MDNLHASTGNVCNSCLKREREREIDRPGGGWVAWFCMLDLVQKMGNSWASPFVYIG